VSAGPTPLLVVGGEVFTAHADHPRAEALAVVGNRIAAVGTTARLEASFPGARRLDVGGRTVLPGLVDAHNHFVATGEMLSTVDVRYPSVASVDELVAALTAAAASTPAGQWVEASGFDHAKYDRPPTCLDLDRATTDHPVFVLHVSGHQGVANSLALAKQGITEETPDPPGGRIVRDEQGRPTGLLVEAALALLQPVVVDIGHHGPNFHVARPLEALVAAVDSAGRAFVAAGLTTVCDAQVTRRELRAYREARQLGRLALRTVCMPLSHQLPELESVGLGSGWGDDWLRLGAMKFYADGSLIGGTAWFSQPYGEHEELTGSAYWDPAEFVEAVGRAHAAGWQLGVHAQGDAAIGLTLDAFSAALERSPQPDPRFRIEHAGGPTRAQVSRMAELGVVTVNQPSYLRDSGDDFIARLGERAPRLQPWREELDAGVRVVLSSDSDVASYRPLRTVAAALTRTTFGGRVVGAGQALTLDEALRAHTVDAAFALRMDDRIGSIEVGKLADLTVVDGDVWDAAPDQLAEMPIWLTLVDGVVAHAAADVPPVGELG
jgi:predicted amidohydrolase YtcJ